MGFGQTVEDAAREKAMKALREFLRPEFLSRVDEVIVFRTLTQEDYARIAALTLDEYVDALKEQSITFMYDTAATEAIAAATHGGRSGARDIRIHIRRKVEDPLAEMIVQQGEGTVTGVKLTTDEQGELLLLTL
jgi:ATP-dependent Clp protease ATP-binding subunit ClpA